MLDVLDKQALGSFDRDTHRTGRARVDHRDQRGQTVEGVSDLLTDPLVAVVVENAQVMETTTPVDAAPETIPQLPINLIHRSEIPST